MHRVAEASVLAWAGDEAHELALNRRGWAASRDSSADWCTRTHRTPAASRLARACMWIGTRPRLRRNAPAQEVAHLARANVLRWHTGLPTVGPVRHMALLN